MAHPIRVTEEDRAVARYDLINRSNEYLRDVEDAAKEGYRPHHCFHGTNLWTDYDNICGPCEDSQYDPRHHPIGSPEFNAVVEDWAEQNARKNRYNLIVEMIENDAKYIETRSDLLSLKVLIDVALDV